MVYLPPFPPEHAKEEWEALIKAEQSFDVAYDNMRELQEKARAAKKRLLKKLKAVGYNENDGND